MRTGSLNTVVLLFGPVAHKIVANLKSLALVGVVSLNEDISATELLKS